MPSFLKGRGLIMTKNHMGKGSLHAQDAQMQEYLPEIDVAVELQPTRPHIQKPRPVKSSKDGFRKR